MDYRHPKEKVVHFQMSQKQESPDAAKLLLEFLLLVYAPKLIGLPGKKKLMKSISWFALFGALLFIPLAVVAVVRSSVRKATDRRYDTSDFISDEPL
jgi:hypothetical protein